MADELFTEDEVRTLEEAERRKELSGPMASLLREARDSGIVKSSRNKELLEYEREMLTLTKDEVTEEEARSWANTYRRLRDGDHEDFDGRKYYGKKFDGYTYLQKLQEEVRGFNMSEKFDDKLNKFDKSNEDGKIKQAQSYLQEKANKVRNKAPRVMREQALRSVGQGVQMGAEETLDVLPDVREDYEKLSTMKPESMSEEQKAKLVKLGRDEAFNRSYVPMRQFLENKLGRNEFANKVARKAEMDGEFDPETYDLLPPEDKAVVDAYIRHTRPFDVSEGVIGTMDQSMRTALWGFWGLAKGTAEISADAQVSINAAMMSWKDPVAATQYLDDWERERKNLRQMGEVFELKAPERNRLGAAVVGLAETTPHMAALIFGGPGGAILAGGAAANQAKARAMMNPDTTPEEGNVIAGVAGIVSIYAEKLSGFGATTKFGKYLSKPLIARATADTMTGFVAKNMPRWAEQVGRNWVAETWIEEFGEAYANNITEQVFTKHEKSIGDSISRIDFHEAIRTATVDAMDSGDVTLLMTLMGGAKGTVSELSANASEMRYSASALDMLDQRVADWVNNNTEEFGEGINDINDLILDIWTNNSEGEARKMLKELGATNADVTAAKPELDAAADKHISMRKLQKQAFAKMDVIEKRYDTYKKAMLADEKGASYEMVEQLTGSLDPSNVGQYESVNNAIEVRNGIKDEGRVFNHEVFHWAVAQGVITEAEFDILRKSAEKGKYKNLSIRYGDITGDAKVEDIMGDAFAEFNTEEQSVWKKSIAWLRNLTGFLKTEQDVFRKLDSYLTDVASTLDEEAQIDLAQPTTVDTAVDTAVDTEVEVDDAAFVQSVIDAANTDLATATAVIEKDNALSELALNNVEAQIETIKARREGNKKQLDEKKKQEDDLEREAERLAKLEADESKVIAESKGDIDLQKESVRRGKEIAKQSRRNQYELKQLKSEVDAIVAEEKKNEEDRKRADEIDNIMMKFDRAAKKGDAMKSRFFKRMNRGPIEAMYKGIEENNPQAVEKATSKIKDAIKEWNSLSITERKARATKAKAQGVKFARETGEAVTPDQLATSYALAKAEGRDAKKWAQSASERYDIPVESIIEKGESQWQRAVQELEDGASVLDKRLAIRTKAQKRAVRAEMGRRVKQGAIIAREAKFAEKRLAKSEALRQSKSLARAKQDAVSPRMLAKNGVDMGLVDSGDADAIYDAVDGAIRSLSDQADVDVDDNPRALAQRRATLGGMLKQWVVSNVGARNQWGLIKAIDGMEAQPSTDSVAKVRKSLAKVMSSVAEVRTKQELLEDKKSLRSTIEALVKQDKKNNRTKPFYKKKVDKNTLADIKNAGKAAKMTPAKVESLKKFITSALDKLASVDAETDVDEAYKEFMSDIVEVFPSLKDMNAREANQRALFYLSNFGNLSGMTKAETVNANEELNKLIETGRFNINERIEKLNEDIADKRWGLEAAVRNIIERNGADSKRWTVSQLSGLFDYLELLRDSGRLNKDETSSVNRFIMQLNSARQQRIGNISNTVKTLNDFIKSEMSLKERRDVIKPREDLSKFDNNGQATSLAAILNVVMTHEQADMQDRVENERRAYENKLERGEDAVIPDIVKQADQIDEMKKVLGDKLLSLGGFLRDMMNNSRRMEAMSEQYSEITASQLRMAPDYWTINLEKDKSIAVGGNLGIFKSFLKSRVGSAKAVDTQLSAFDVAQKHVIDVETFNAFGGMFLSTTNSYLEPKAMKQMGLALGDAAMGRMTDMLADELNGGPLVRGNQFAPLDAFTTFVVYKGLSYNPFTPVKQLVDFPSVGALLPGFGKYWFEGLNEAGRAATKRMMKHPSIQARARDGYNQHTAEAISEAEGIGAGQLRKALTMGMQGVQKGDYASVYLSAGAAYRAAMDMPDIKTIEDVNERDKAASDMAVLMLERALQSPHKTDRPHFVARGGSTARFFAVFSSALTPKAAQILKELDTLRLAGKTEGKVFKRLARKAAVYHGVAATLQWGVSVLIQLGFTDDEFDEGEMWELLATMVFGPFAGVPLLGIAIESAFQGMSGGMARGDIASSFGRDMHKMGKVIADTAKYAAGQSEDDWTDIMEEVWDNLFRSIPMARRVDQAYEKWIK